MKRILLVASALVSLALLLLASWFAGSLLTAPARRAVGDLPPDLTGRAVEFQSESQTIIRGWFLPGQAGRGTVVLMHGVRASRRDMLNRARFLSRAGYAVLLFDFQAHGESDGRQITFGYLESKDVRAAIDFARVVSPQEKLGVIGVSMGGAAATLSSPPLSVDAIVLEQVYPTLREAIGDRIALRLGPWSKVLTPLLSWQLRPRLGVSDEVLRPLDHVAKISAPKLFIGGSEDRHTTPSETRRIVDAATEPKEVWMVAGARHVDLCRFAQAEYEERILRFFSRHLTQGRGP